MKIRSAVSFLVLGLVVASAVYYIASLGTRIGPPHDRVNVAMQVSDVNGLVVDSNVLLRGVPVGKVTGVHTSINSATVDFYVDKKYPIPADSEVRLENLSALGESYIGLIPRTTSGPMLRDGQRVATENIKQPASISELATSVVHLLNQMDPGQLSRLVKESDRALPKPDEVLPNLTRASVMLRNAVTSMDGNGSKVLADLQTLLQNAGWVGPAIAQISPIVQQLGPPLNRGFEYSLESIRITGSPEVFYRFLGFINKIQKFLDERAPDLKMIAEALMPNVQGMAAALMNVDTGQILSNMVNTFPQDGVVTLRLNVQNP